MPVSEMTFGETQTKTISLLKDSYIKGINNFCKYVFAKILFILEIIFIF